jgi:hypothetical protein
MLIYYDPPSSAQYIFCEEIVRVRTIGRILERQLNEDFAHLKCTCTNEEAQRRHLEGYVQRADPAS